MNIPAAKKVVAHLKRLQKTPRAARFNMAYWGEPFNPELKGYLKKPICGTQACLAGETVLAHRLGNIKKGQGIRVKSDAGERDIEQLAIHVLGLSHEERYRLFYLQKFRQAYGWPDQFEQAYFAAKTPAKRLQVAIERFEHFISTNGAE